MRETRRYAWERLTLMTSIPVKREEGEELDQTYKRVKYAWMMYRYQHRKKGQPFVECEFVADLDRDLVFVILKAEGRRSITPKQAARIKRGPLKRKTKSKEVPLVEYPFAIAG